MEAGWRGKLDAIKEVRVWLSVQVFWKRSPRIDWKNMYGGIEDALFSEDRYVIPGKYNDVVWDNGYECAFIFIEVECKE
jgi:hypothetical protein